MSILYTVQCKACHATGASQVYVREGDAGKITKSLFIEQEAAAEELATKYPEASMRHCCTDRSLMRLVCGIRCDLCAECTGEFGETDTESISERRDEAESLGWMVRSFSLRNHKTILDFCGTCKATVAAAA